MQPPASTSDDEVMAALQTLIPTESMSSPAASINLSSNDVPAAPLHAASPRWIAEEVNLAGDEVALSLEKEMEAAYATFSGQGAHAVPISPEASLAPTNGEAHMVAPAENEQAVVHAMASAAAAGEGTPVVAAVFAQTPAENSTIEPSHEVIAAPIPEPPANISAMPTVADAAHVANEMMEGDVMAASWKNIRDSIAGSCAETGPLKGRIPRA